MTPPKSENLNKDQLHVLENAIVRWGRNNQINKIQEELLELSLVLNQLKCPTKDTEEMEFKLYDELADVVIMMEQAKILFDSDRISERVNHKILKLKTKHGL